jgi:hypothetical protein
MTKNIKFHVFSKTSNDIFQKAMKENYFKNIEHFNVFELVAELDGCIRKHKWKLSLN